MAIPIILGVGAALAGIGGVVAGVDGASKMKDANDTMESAKNRHNTNIKSFKSNNRETTMSMDKLGKKELEILKQFERFSKVIEKIHNKPEFSEINKEGIKIPKYDAKELEEVSVGAGVLLGGIGGAAMGTAGGFAAAGATTAAVMALGTASTGTAIASLSGVAATNATLAALGGGAIAAGGGGMALGTAILGGATLGVGLLVGGVIFNFTGNSLSEKADEAWEQMLEAEKEIHKVSNYLLDLKNTSLEFYNALVGVHKVYRKEFQKLCNTVERKEKRDWNTFTDEEKTSAENTILLVGLLFEMAKTKIVLKAKKEDGLNEINKKDIRKAIDKADNFLGEREFVS